jgi:hypothetical protein
MLDYDGEIGRGIKLKLRLNPYNKMKFKKSSLVIILCVLSINSYADCFKGTIGSYSIIIDFPTTDIGRYSDNGGYFYEKKLQKIIFSEAKGTKEHIVLKTYDAPNEEFDLFLNKDGSYQGTWKELTSKKILPVKIKPFEFKNIKNSIIGNWNDSNSEDPLWYIASSKIKFVRDTTVTIGKIKIDWYSDNIYKIKFFRIHSPTNPVLYKYLEDRHLRLIEALFRGCKCDEIGDELPNGIFLVKEVGKGIISYNFSQGICYCYSAAHPSWFEISENLDVINDEVLDFDKVFHFSKNPSLYTENESDANRDLKRITKKAYSVLTESNEEDEWAKWVKYREAFVAPEMVKILRLSNPSLLESPENEEDKVETECYFLENEKWWSLESWELKKDGIIVKYFDGATGYGPCMERFEISKKYLINFLTPQYKNRIFQN